MPCYALLIIGKLRFLLFRFVAFFCCCFVFDFTCMVLHFRPLRNSEASGGPSLPVITPRKLPDSKYSTIHVPYNTPSGFDYGNTTWHLWAQAYITFYIPWPLLKRVSLFQRSRYGDSVYPISVFTVFALSSPAGITSGVSRTPYTTGLPSELVKHKQTVLSASLFVLSLTERHRPRGLISRLLYCVSTW